MKQETLVGEITEREIAVLFDIVNSVREQYQDDWTPDKEQAYQTISYIWWMMPINSRAVMYEEEELDESDLPF